MCYVEWGIIPLCEGKNVNICSPISKRSFVVDWTLISVGMTPSFIICLLVAKDP